MQAHLVVDGAGLAALSAAGAWPWLRAWLDGGGGVALWHFDQHGWREQRGAVLVVADEARLAKAALAHGKRVGADARGRCVLGAEAIALTDPPRTAWAYSFTGGRAALIPPGDLLFQRDRWLAALLPDAPLRRWVVATEGPGEDEIEPGVRLVQQRPEGGIVFAGDGMLPEAALVRRMQQAGIRLRLAESCTAGLAAARVARVPGASTVLDRGWVVYANAAKEELLGVSHAVLAAHGAVSRQAVESMARSGAARDALCVAISGIAGPGGGSADKPVGTVWMAAMLGRHLLTRHFEFAGGRAEIRARAAVWALALAWQMLDTAGAPR